MRGGHRIGAGRKKGQPGSSTQAVREYLAKKNFDPIEKLVELFENEKSDHQTKVKIATELCQYCHPKLKALDLKTEPHNEMTIYLGVPPRPEFKTNADVLRLSEQALAASPLVLDLPR